jgi:hypothetical protein
MARQLEEFNELVKLCRYLGDPIPEVESIEDKVTTFFFDIINAFNI